MALQGTFVLIERELADTAPSLVYLEDHPSVGGRYVLGDSRLVATAFLKADPIASALGRFVLDDDPAEEDRALYLVSSTRIAV